ncbi:MAG: roadblock/LC7 domain-containing protein [Acidimicrobiia bacterium]|nr:roadblock/LC7 domain-containing protein [Acidimicrobiia bacterium]
MRTRGEQIAEALDSFLQSCPDVEGAAIMSADGLPMASALPEGFQEERIAAMAAAMLGLGEKAAETLGRGSMRQLFVEGDHGFIYLMSAGPSAVLCAVSRPSGKTGLVLYEMKEAAGRIARALTPLPRQVQPERPTPVAETAPREPTPVQAERQMPVEREVAATQQARPAEPPGVEIADAETTGDGSRAGTKGGGTEPGPAAPVSGLHAVAAPPVMSP